MSCVTSSGWETIATWLDGPSIVVALHGAHDPCPDRVDIGLLASYDGAAELERGLDILLTGLAATLSPTVAGRPAEPGPLAE